MTHKPPYLKDEGFELVLAELNEALNPVEKRLVSGFDAPQYPMLLVAGVPRSGTTLLMQRLISTFELGYPSNLMARFWRAPYMGARLVQELRRGNRRQGSNLVSELGSTYGYEEPHEFTYFWGHWFPFGETHQPREELIASIDYSLLRQELAAVESAFGLPLAFKNPVVFSLNMETLARALPTSIFLVCRRHPWYVARSLLQGRVKLHGTVEEWFSIKPAEYASLRDLPVAQQIAGQVYHTCQKIDRSMARLESDRFLIVDYDELCQQPAEVLSSIARRVSAKGCELRATGAKVSPVAVRDRQGMSDADLELKNAVGEFFGSSLARWGESKERLMGS